MSHTTTKLVDGPCAIRIIAVNDVYQLDNLPSFKTCVSKESDFPGLTITVLAGDFLAPSLLSRLDHGIGMVDILNSCHLDYVCFGNHEADVSWEDLLVRITDSRFTWLNSNITGMPLPAQVGPSKKPFPALPQYVVLEVQNGTSKRRIALVGLVTEDQAIYHEGIFGGGIISPLQETAAALLHSIQEAEKANGGVDIIIPLTHQVMPLDRKLASEVGQFPLIIGGHDHEPYDEVVNGCRIIKTGADGVNIAICDVVWPSHQPSDTETKIMAPEITVTLKKASEYPADEAVAKLVQSHSTILDDLKSSSLFTIPTDPHPSTGNSVTLSSKGVRLRPTSLAQLLCTKLRSILHADCALLNAGCIRGNADYQPGQQVTYADLENELPLGAGVVVVELPGKVINDAINYSRSFALQTPPKEQGCYLQIDDELKWDRDALRVLAINKQPFDESRLYKAVVLFKSLHGLDHIVPLCDYVQQLPNDHKIRQLSNESVCEAKSLLVEHFSKNLLLHMVETTGLIKMDADGDGRISKEELLGSLRDKAVADNLKAHRSGVDPDAVTMPSKIVVNNLFKLCDPYGETGFIDIKALISLRLSAFEDFVFDSRHPLDAVAVEELITAINSLLGSNDSKTMLFDSIFRL